MNSKKIIFIFLLTLGVFFSACKPDMLDKPSYDNPPSVDDNNFEITQGDDAFTYTLKNTSNVVGIAQWDLGNGLKATGNEVTATYNFPGEFEIVLTLVTNGGMASTSHTFTQTETNYDILTDDVYLNICGGVDSLNGRSWVLDSLTWGHIGVGPTEGDGSDWCSWWGADPLAKSGFNMYDDKINFNIVDFAVTYDNNGKSYVKEFQIGNSAYSNPVQNDGDYTVTYPGPINGNWTINSVDDVDYLILTGNTPVFPNFDVGAVNNSYQITSLSQNEMQLRCVGADGSAWYYILIPEGYARPEITFSLNVAETANVNEYDLSLSDLEVPASVSIVSIDWTFDDPLSENYTTSDQNEVVTHTYMMAGTYNLTATITDSEGSTFEESSEIVVAEDHPNYTPYIESGMSMYIDFDNVFRPIFVDNADGSGSFKIVSNPSVGFTNGSENVCRFEKNNAQWTNLYIPLSDAYRLDFSQSTKFKLLVYGSAGDSVLLKVENMDLGGNAWTTGAEIRYYIQESYTWELAEFDFSGVGTAQGQSSDITTDPTYSSDYYNVIRIMLNPGDNTTTCSVYLDDWAGLLVPGWKSSKK